MEKDYKNIHTEKLSAKERTALIKETAEEIKRLQGVYALLTGEQLHTK